MAEYGLCLVITGPAASGKTTLAEHVLASHPDAVRMVTTTSRTPREGEVDGVDYHFITETRFLEMIEADAFLEHAHTYGRRYGSSRAVLEELRAAHAVVVVVIDTEGMKAYRRLVRDAKCVFIDCPDDQLRARLGSRSGADSEDVERRLSRSSVERADAAHCDAVLMNADGLLDTHVLAEMLRLIAEWTAPAKESQRCACGRATSCTAAHGSHLVRIRLPKRSKPKQTTE